MHTAASPTTSNPFSPVKGKTRQHPVITRPPEDYNPFSSPEKSPRKPKRAQSSRGSSRGVSPDPFSDAPGPPSSASSSKLLFPPALPLTVLAAPELASGVDVAITRARKRLRGEPVSPSPSKEKRRRVLSGLNRGLPRKSMPFPKLGAPLLGNAGPSMSDEDEDMHDLSFIADSPVKLPSADTNKAFKLLFDEPLPAPAFAEASSTRRRAASGDVRKEAGDSWDVDMDGDEPLATTSGDPSKPVAKALSASHDGTGKPPRKVKAVIPGARVPGKDNLWAEGQTALDADAPSQPNHRGHAGQPSKKPAALAQASQKRTHSHSKSGADVEEDATSPAPSASMSASTSATLVATMPLLPPSPPPANGKTYKPRYKASAKFKAHESGKAKGKSKARAQESDAARKKQRMSSDAETPPDSIDGEREEDNDSDEHENVRVFDWGSSQRALLGIEDGGALSDFDPEFDFSLSRRAAKHLSPPMHIASEDNGGMEVDLPDDLQRLLAFSLPVKPSAEAGARRTKARKDREEEVLARAVLSGTRPGHYDATRGGEIWDVGEIGEEGGTDGVELEMAGGAAGKAGALTDDDDDWEGEGVPWEVGEL